MTVQRKDVARKVIPRFHSPFAAIKQGELAAPASASRRLDRPRADDRIDPLFRLRLDWETNRSPSFAADFVAAAFVLGREGEAAEAAEFLLTKADRPLRRQVARRLLGEAMIEESDDFNPLKREDVHERIRDLKRLLRFDPRAALFWAELARRYAALGQRDKARDAMTTALRLAPNDRFLLRSAARLNLFLDDPEQAHQILSKAVAGRPDPWLVAAEIAVAPLAGRQSRLIKHGKQLLDSGKFRPVAMSELASALGTEALSAGSARDARKLFATSLAEPTENAVAQAEWASRQGARIELSADVLDEVRNSYEAHAQIASEKGDSDIAIQNAWLWLKDEPFASIPAIFGSHEASMAREYEEAILFAEVGLVANPQEFLLRNNLAFAMASVGRVDDAEVQLGEIHASALSARDALVYKATRGLIAFRKGAVAEGRQLYEETIRGTNDPIMRAIAAIVLAREEILAETPNGVFARGLAESLADEAKASPAQARKENLLGWLAHLERELSGARG